MSTRNILACFTLLTLFLFGCSKKDSNPQSSQSSQDQQVAQESQDLTNSEGVQGLQVPQGKSQPTCDPGGRNNSIKFPGYNGFVEIPYSPVYKPAEFSIEMWVYVDEIFSSFIPFISSSNTDDWNTADGFSLKYETGMLYFRLGIAYNVAASAAVRYTFPVKKWVHVAGTFDGATAKLYVNGSLVAQNAIGQPVYYGTHGLQIGTGYHSQFGGNSFFRGMIDEVRIWDVVRDSAQIRSEKKIKLTESRKNLVGYWNFDHAPKSNIVTDNSKYNNDGKILGDAYITSAAPF